MKKIFAVLFLISFLAVLVVPLVASAQVADCCKVRRSFNFEGTTYVNTSCAGVTGATPATCGCSGTSSVPTANNLFETEKWGMVCVLNVIYRVADLIFAILIAFSILLILMAAYTFFTAAGDPGKVNTARNYILYALVGLVVAFLARAIPSIVQMLI